MAQVQDESRAKMADSAKRRHARARHVEETLMLVADHRDRLLAENSALALELAMLRTELAAYRAALRQPQAAA